MKTEFRVPEDFQPFDWRKDFWNYERNLPHWRQPGATYFITFRLNDSLPTEVLDRFKRERDEWERRLADYEGRPSETMMDEYIAWQRQHWRKMENTMDEGHGSCVIKHPATRQVVEDALLFFEGQRNAMHGFVLMPNHVHLVARPLGEWQIEELIKSWKGYTSRVLNEALGRKGALWQEDSWNRIIRDEEHWLRVMRYLFRNPAKAGLRHDEFTLWQAQRTVVERVFQPVLREDAHASSQEDDPW